jgi:dienelactone hydrolase
LDIIARRARRERLKPRFGWGIALLFALIAAPCVAAAEVEVTTGTRTTALGDPIPYALYVPQPGSGPTDPPYPALILTHGFARDYGRHIDKAVRFARHGLIVLTPSLLPADAGATAHARNVANTADHHRWLATRGADPADPLFGLVDAQRIALAGHSAGAAISLEATQALQRRGAPVAALVLLDGATYARTERIAPLLRELPLLSLRSEPSACNEFGAIENLPALVRFPITDIEIAGATHCAPEGPTDIACEVLCGVSTDEAHAAYEALTEGFLEEALGVVRPAPTTEHADMPAMRQSARREAAPGR